MVGLFRAIERAGVRRRAFFSFHYDDIHRVNVVRKSGEFATSQSDSGRHIEGFYDASLWESRKLNGEQALRNLIRTGVQNTSVVCVLVGSKTFSRPWVRYEIARSVIDGKGLLAVHINSINDIRPPYGAKDRGDNPCRYLGIAKGSNGSYYLCERHQADGQWTWRWYGKHTDPVDVPKYMKPPELNQPRRLSDVTREYDWSQNGHKNIGEWLDMAADDVRR